MGSQLWRQLSLREWANIPWLLMPTFFSIALSLGVAFLIPHLPIPKDIRLQAVLVAFFGCAWLFQGPLDLAVILWSMAGATSIRLVLGSILAAELGQAWLDFSWEVLVPEKEPAVFAVELRLALAASLIPFLFYARRRGWKLQYGNSADQKKLTTGSRFQFSLGLALLAVTFAAVVAAACRSWPAEVTEYVIMPLVLALTTFPATRFASRSSWLGETLLILVYGGFALLLHWLILHFDLRDAAFLFLMLSLRPALIFCQLVWLGRNGYRLVTIHSQ